MGFNKSLTISILIVTMLMTGITTFLFSAADNYNIVLDDDLKEDFNEYSALQDEFKNTQAIIEGGDINPEGQDQAVYKNVIVAGKQAQQSSSIFLKMVGRVSKYISIPAGIMLSLGSLVLVLVTYGFLRMITKEDP